MHFKLTSGLHQREHIQLTQCGKKTFLDKSTTFLQLYHAFSSRNVDHLVFLTNESHPENRTRSRQNVPITCAINRQMLYHLCFLLSPCGCQLILFPLLMLVKIIILPNQRNQKISELARIQHRAIVLNLVVPSTSLKLQNILRVKICIFLYCYIDSTQILGKSISPCQTQACVFEFYLTRLNSIWQDFQNGTLTQLIPQESKMLTP